MVSGCEACRFRRWELLVIGADGRQGGDGTFDTKLSIACHEQYVKLFAQSPKCDIIMCNMIYLAADHRGYNLKEQIKQWLDEWQLEYIDCGALAFDPEDDYPDFVAVAAEKVAQDPTGNRGIVIGATGQGEAMVANHRRGVRAAVYYGGPKEILTLSREHNASNVLAIGASFIGDDAKDIIKLWLDTPFSNEERHVRRIAKIEPR